MDAASIARKVMQNMIIVNATKINHMLGPAGIILGGANALGAARTREQIDQDVIATLGPLNYGNGHFIAAERHAMHVAAYLKNQGGASAYVDTEARRSERKYIEAERPTPVAVVAAQLSADGKTAGQTWLQNQVGYQVEAELIYNDLVQGA